MTKTEQNRVLAWRLKVLREASVAPRNVAQTCRHFGLSRKAFYKWKARYEAHGEAGLCDRPRGQGVACGLVVLSTNCEALRYAAWRAEERVVNPK